MTDKCYLYSSPNGEVEVKATGRFAEKKLNMSKEIVKNFNLILESFLSQITPLVGSFYIKKFQLIIKCNSTLPIEKFLVHALPLRDKILNRDESYFSNYSLKYLY